MGLALESGASASFLHARLKTKGAGGAKGTRQYSEYTPLHLPLNSKIDDNMSQKIGQGNGCVFTV